MIARGQSVVEFLVTYGFALIAIALILAALFALGAFNPEKKSSVRGFSKFSCQDHELSRDRLDLSLLNGTTYNLKANKYKICIDMDLDGSEDRCITGSEDWHVDTKKKFTLNLAGLTRKQNLARIWVEYETDHGFVKRDYANLYFWRNFRPATTGLMVYDFNVPSNYDYNTSEITVEDSKAKLNTT